MVQRARPFYLDDDEDGPPPPPKATTSVAEDAPAKAPGREPPTPEKIAALQARREKIAEDGEALREKAIQDVSKVLTSSQRNAFNRLLGKRIPDLSTLLSEPAMALGGAPGYSMSSPSMRIAAPSTSGGAGVRPVAPAKKNLIAAPEGARIASHDRAVVLTAKGPSLHWDPSRGVHFARRSPCA